MLKRIGYKPNKEIVASLQRYRAGQDSVKVLYILLPRTLFFCIFASANHELELFC